MMLNGVTKTGPQLMVIDLAVLHMTAKSNISYTRQITEVRPTVDGLETIIIKEHITGLNTKFYVVTAVMRLIRSGCPEHVVALRAWSKDRVYLCCRTKNEIILQR